MRNLLKGSAALLFAAAVAAGSAAGDPPPWSGSSKRPARDESRGYGQPTLTGTATRDFRSGRYLEVRCHDTTYRVDVSRAVIRGADSGRVGRNTRVLVWGQIVEGRTIRASRVQVLGDGDRDDAWDKPRRDDDVRQGPWGRPRRDDRDGSYSRRALSGQVTHRSSPTGSRNIRVSARDEEWLVEVPKGIAVIRDGRSISIHEVREGSYVRIQGERLDGGNRFRAQRVDVRPAEQAEGWRNPRPDQATAYDGSVRDVNANGSSFRIRLNRFETCTVRVDGDTDLVRGGRRASFRDLREGTRVRVYGRLDQRARSLDARTVEIL